MFTRPLIFALLSLCLVSCASNDQGHSSVNDADIIAPGQCGDGQIDPGEGCDEGAANGPEGTCSRTCQRTHMADCAETATRCEGGRVSVCLGGVWRRPQPCPRAGDICDDVTQRCVAVDPCDTTQCAPGEACVGGDCRVVCGATICNEAEGCREDTCTPLCGGRLCTTEQTCIEGQCVDRCANTRCGIDCVDLTRDPRHCGECNLACPPANLCRVGVCTCSGFVDPRFDPVPFTLTAEPDPNRISITLACAASSLMLDGSSTVIGRHAGADDGSWSLIDNLQRMGSTKRWFAGERIDLFVGVAPTGSDLANTQALVWHIIAQAQPSNGQLTELLEGIPSADDVVDLATGDMDNDGRLDAVLVHASGMVDVWFHDTTGWSRRRAGREQSVVGQNSARQAHIGDFDVDGDLDVFILREGFPNTLLVNLGQGDFRLSPSAFGIEVDLDLASTQAHMGFMDGNAGMDLVVVDALEAPMLLLSGGLTRTGGANDERQQFTILATQSVGHEPIQALATGDLDGDYDTDLIVSDAQGTRIWFNDGKGRLTLPATPTNLPSSPATAIAMADIDLNGTLDVFLGYANAPPVVVRRDPDPARGFLAAEALGNAQHTLRFHTLDINGDGRPDTLTTTPTETLLWINDGVGDAIRWNARVLVTEPVSGLDSGDLDGDGDVDLLMSVGHAAPRIWRND